LVEKPYERQQAALAALDKFAERVVFYDPGPSWLPEWAARRFRRAVELHVEQLAVNDENLAHIGQLTHLERLYLARTLVTDSGMRHLAGLTKLRRLSLWGTRLSDEGVQHLAPLKQLEALDIHETKCSQACLKHLAPAKRMKRLRVGFPLDDRGIAELVRLTEEAGDSLRCHHVTAEGLSELSRLQGISTLWLEETTLSAAEAQALVGITGLRALDARAGRIDRPALAALRDCRSLKEVHLIEMGIPIGDVLAEYGPAATEISLHTGVVDLRCPAVPLRLVAQSSKAPFDVSALSSAAGLRWLHFNEAEYHGPPVDFRRLAKLNELVWIPPLADAQLRQLGELSELNCLVLRLRPGLSPAALGPLAALGNLQRLTLYRCHLTDEHLSFLQHLTSLRELALGENPLKGACLAHLRELTQLQQLSLLECTQLDEANLKHLREVTSLTHLTLQYTPVTDNGLKWLHGMPNLRGVTLLRSRVTNGGKAALKATLPAGADVF
jgi:hypothetical protein